MLVGLLLTGILGINAAGQQAAADSGVVTAPSLVQARELAGKGRLEAALAELELLAKTVPEAMGVERLRGMIYYQKDMLPSAEAAFGRAIAQDSSDRESIAMRGVTLYRLGRPGEAIPLLEQARTMGSMEATVATDPSGDPSGDRGATSQPGSRLNVEPSYVLGLAYVDTKRYDDARRAFAAQFGFGSDSAEAYLVAARLLLRREFAEKAGEFAAKAVELNPKLPLAHQLLGEVALAKADLPLAVRELEAERALNPLNGQMYDRLGDAYVRNGQYEEARTALNRAILLEPNATGPYILLGEALVKLGDAAQAVHYLSRAEKMDPGNSVTHTVLGQAYRALGRMADANREYKLAVEIQHRSDPKPEAQPPANPEAKPAGAQ